MKKLCLGLLLLGLLWSCKGEEKGCTFTEFPAVFPQELSLIKNYQYESFEGGSSENFELNGILRYPIKVRFLQKGCKELVQELHFEIDDSQDPIPADLPPSNCARLLAGIFLQLGQSHPQLSILGNYAELFGRRAPNFEYNQPLLLQDGFTAQIDKLSSKSYTVISLTLRQTNEEE